MATLAALMSLAHWTWLAATLVSVEVAVVHNFFWHERWTWCDRAVARSHQAPSHLALLTRLARFHIANGLASIVGNAALMALLVGVLGLPAIPANALAVAAMSVANFVLAGRWVFDVRVRQGATYTAAAGAPKRPQNSLRQHIPQA